MGRQGWTTTNLFWSESATTFHARNPFPPGGAVEDPATGAAAAAFGGYLRDLRWSRSRCASWCIKVTTWAPPAEMLVDIDPTSATTAVTGRATQLALALRRPRDLGACGLVFLGGFFKPLAGGGSSHREALSACPRAARSSLPTTSPEPARRPRHARRALGHRPDHPRPTAVTGPNRSEEAMPPTRTLRPSTLRGLIISLPGERVPRDRDSGLGGSHEPSGPGRLRRHSRQTPAGEGRLRPGGGGQPLAGHHPVHHRVDRYPHC